MAIFEVEGGERGVVALKVGTMRLSMTSQQLAAASNTEPAVLFP